MKITRRIVKMQIKSPMEWMNDTMFYLITIYDFSLGNQKYYHRSVEHRAVGSEVENSPLGSSALTGEGDPLLYSWLKDSPALGSWQLKREEKLAAKNDISILNNDES